MGDRAGSHCSGLNKEITKKIKRKKKIKNGFFQNFEFFEN
jgi:hypothetical protein